MLGYNAQCPLGMFGCELSELVAWEGERRGEGGVEGGERDCLVAVWGGRRVLVLLDWW